MRKQPAKKIRLDYGYKMQYPVGQVICIYNNCQNKSHHEGAKFWKIRSERGKPRFLCQLHAEQDRCSILDEIEIV
jgi:hypothetical protein